jgi:ketopantoate reductase
MHSRNRDAHPRAHLDALCARGIEVCGPERTFTAPVGATDVPEALGRAEYTLVTFKNDSPLEVAPATRTLAEAGSVILPLLNGVEVVDHLVGHGVPRDRVLGGLTAISAARVGPGIVERRGPFQRVIVGEMECGASKWAGRIVTAFRVPA